MRAVEQEVDSRLAEVELYLNFIKTLERIPKTGALFPGVQQSAPILKACTFLLLYNLIESCVRSAFAQTYLEMSAEGVLFTSSTEHIKKIWIKQRLSFPADTANQQTYLTYATQIASSIADGETLELDSRKLPVSGNLDGDQIRLLCNKHGVELKVSKWAQGGAQLVVIREQRNALAHGHKSFSECGRDYGVKDLERIYKQTRHFIKGFIKSVSSFNAKHAYRL